MSGQEYDVEIIEDDFQSSNHEEQEETFEDISSEIQEKSNQSSYDAVMEIKTIFQEIRSLTNSSDSPDSDDESIDVQEILVRVQKLEKSLKKLSKLKKKQVKEIWQNFDAVKCEQDLTAEKLMAKINMAELAIANFYQQYDEVMNKLRRRVEQLEAENEMLKESLLITNMLNHIRENSSQESRSTSSNSSSSMCESSGFTFIPCATTSNEESDGDHPVLMTLDGRLASSDDHNSSEHSGYDVSEGGAAVVMNIETGEKGEVTLSHERSSQTD